MSKRPIVKADGVLNLTTEQAQKALTQSGLPVCFAFRDRRRRIMKGRLVVRGCSCCGIFADIVSADPDKARRYVSFQNIFSVFSPLLGLNEHD